MVCAMPSKKRLVRLRRRSYPDYVRPLPPTFKVPPMPTRLFTAPLMDAMPDRVFAGPVRRYDIQTRGQIPAQWDAYNYAYQRASSPSPDDYYGLVFNHDAATGCFDYMCGQVLLPDVVLPDGFRTLSVPIGNWARFVTKDHIATMNSAWAEVMGHWLGQPGCIPRDGPSIEYYSPAFDGATGRGGYEIWLPVV